MPRPHDLRPSKLRNAASRPGDDADAVSGGWSRERLIAMDRRFATAMARAAAGSPAGGPSGLEGHHPGSHPARAAQRPS